MLELRSAVKRYSGGGSIFKRRWLTALDHLSLTVRRGEFFSLVGESGCGKSTLARAVAGLENLDDGELYLDGQRVPDISVFKDRQMRRRVQMIFQDPYSSLNPRMRVGDILREPLKSFGWGDAAAIERRVAELAEIIRFPLSALERYPHQFSGVMGNYLKTDKVVPAMHRAWLDTEGELFEKRLLAAVTAGRDNGGDLGGHRSSCLVVYETEAYARTDLRIDFMPSIKGKPDAVDALAELLKQWTPLIEYYKVRPHNPAMPGWQAWLEEQGTPYKD